MCNPIAAAVVVTALSAASEAYANDQKASAEAKVIDDKSKETRKYRDMMSGEIQGTLDDHSQESRDAQEAVERDAATTQDQAAIDNGLATTSATSTGAGGQVQAIADGDLAQKVGARAAKDGRGRSAIGASGLAAYGRQSRQRDSLSRSATIGNFAEGAMQTLPYELAVAQDAGAGWYTAAQLGNAAAGGLASYGGTQSGKGGGTKSVDKGNLKTTPSKAPTAKKSPTQGSGGGFYQNQQTTKPKSQQGLAAWQTKGR